MRRLPFTHLIASLCLATLLALPTAVAGEAGEKPVEKDGENASHMKDFEIITEKQEQAIQKGAKWLAAKQNSDGSWEDRGGNSTAMTGLAGCALLSTGSTPRRGPYGQQVRKAIDWCLKHQDAQGLYAGKQDGRGMYGHGFITTFLSQAYGMGLEPEMEDKVRASLIKAVKLIARSQSHNGGWYYQPESNNDEGSVTITQAQALRCAANAGIPVPDKTIKEAISYMHKSQNSDGTINYSIGTGGGGGSPALTAAGAMVFFSLGKYSSTDDRAKKTMGAVRRAFRARGVGAGGGHQCYTDFYAAQAFHMSSEADYAEFFPKIRDHITKTQGGDGSWQGDSAGPVYGTSMNLMILCIGYNYLPMFQR